MYLGRVVETGSGAEIYKVPRHPYTHALIAAVPKLSAGKSEFTPIAGEIPSALDPPAGCVFHPRCPLAIARCRLERPATRMVEGRCVACHRAEEMPEAAIQAAHA
jgi:oligopeptide/dipeptide ABC transporter ATP-binding protein